MIGLVASAWADEVVVWHAWRGAEAEGLVAASDVWEARTGHEVRLVEVPFGAFGTKVETAIPRGNGPDLFLAGHDALGKWERLGVLTPIDVGVAGLRPVAVEAVTWKGQTWGVPLAVKSVVLLYDPAVIAVPPTTTDELLALARAHTSPGRPGIAWQAAEPYFHAAWMHGFGGAAFEPDGRVALDAPTQIAALRFVARVAVDEGLLPLRPTAERIGQLYDEGKVPLVISGPWFAADRARPIAAAPLPIVSETGLPARPYLTVDTAFVAAGAPHADLALDLARFLAGPDGAAIRAATGHQVPSLAAATPTDPILAAIARQAEAAVPMPVDPAITTVFESQARALRRVMRGSASPEAAAAEAQAYQKNLSKPPPVARDPRPYVATALLAAIVALVAFGRRAWAARATIRAHAADYLWVAPAAITVTGLVMVPFVVGAVVAFYAQEGATWTFVGIDHFVAILTSRDWPITSPMSFFYTLAVTVLWTTVNVALHAAIGVGLAMVLREPWIRMRGVFRALLVLPWAIPNYITALIWRTMFDVQYGAVNTILGAITGQDGPAPIDWFGRFSLAFTANLVTNTWLGFPFMMVVTLGALASIPRELEEAAELDGAAGWTRFRHVVWPLLAPALLPSIVLGSVWTFNLFNVVYLVSAGEPDGATEILISQAYRWAFSRGNQYGYAAAYAVILFFVLIGYSRLSNWIVGFGRSR